MTACLLYAKIHKNKAENLLHLMLYFSTGRFIGTKILTEGVGCVILVQDKCMVGQSPGMRKF